jgi:hypothetical protein
MDASQAMLFLGEPVENFYTVWAMVQSVCKSLKVSM